MRNLQICSLALLAAAACVEPSSETAPDLGTAAAALTSGQGSDYQGSDYQGSDYQGSDYQGSDYQGSDYQGATLGGVALSDGSVDGTALGVWRVLRYPRVRHEQRLPDRTCLWDSSRTVSYGCTTVNLATAPSPLAGVAFPATFRDVFGNSFSGRVRIASSVGAVARDTSRAMFRLKGHANPEVCPWVAYGSSGCDNPDGCRINCDLWTYDLELLDADGAVHDFCPGGARAYAVAGTYAANGQRLATGTQFTFACAGGTIAKCTRWGYRPFGVSRKNTGTSTYALLNYHQACLRAATADYCSSGHSFTQNGTLVDIWDYQGTGTGMVPRTKSLIGATATAFVLESTYDRVGAREIDYLRYEELTGQALEDPAVGCPDRFLRSSDDATLFWTRNPAAGTWTNPVVSVDSTTACAHSELTIGKWLNGSCTTCAFEVADHPDYAYCGDPADPRGWDAACVARAQTICTSFLPPMTSHSECTASPAGTALGKYSTGCTLRVCLDNPACCTGAWTSTCAAAANAKCRGGQEHGGAVAQGFCGQPVSPGVAQ